MGVLVGYGSEGVFFYCGLTRVWEILEGMFLWNLELLVEMNSLYLNVLWGFLLGPNTGHAFSSVHILDGRFSIGVRYNLNSIS